MAKRSGISKPVKRIGSSTLRRDGLVRSAQTSSDAGLRAPRFRMRYCSVRPESTMSSTISTWRPSIGVSRSLRIRTTPLESVAEPYDETAMKSTSHGIEIWRMRSARKNTAPLRTPMSRRSRSAYSAVIASPSACTFCLSSSGWTRISPMSGSRMRRRSLRPVRPQGRCALAAQHAAVHDGSRAGAEVERALAEREDLVEPAGRPRAQRAGRILGKAPDDEPREGAGQRGEVLDRDDVAARERGVDDDVEDLRLVAQLLGGPQDVALRGRVDRAQRRHEAPAHAPARVTIRVVGRVVAPGEAALAAPRGGLLARDCEQRTDEPPRARRHPEQRAAARRCGEAVEDRLGLVGRRVGGGGPRGGAGGPPPPRGGPPTGAAP